MSMKYIREQYKVPAKRGLRVRLNWEREPVFGIITGSRGAHLRVRPDGCKYSGLFHPDDVGYEEADNEL